jgi:hypothetical protein
MDTLTAAEYAALDRKPIVIYTIPLGRLLAGDRVRIGNAQVVPQVLWADYGETVQLIKAETGHKLYVKPDTILEVER